MLSDATAFAAAAGSSQASGPAEGSGQRCPPLTGCNVLQWMGLWRFHPFCPFPLQASTWLRDLLLGGNSFTSLPASIAGCVDCLDTSCLQLPYLALASTPRLPLFTNGPTTYTRTFDVSNNQLASLPPEVAQYLSNVYENYIVLLVSGNVYNCPTSGSADW